MVSPNWWKTAFDDKYLKTYVDYSTSEATKNEVEFLLQQLSLPKKAHILDLACGTGRHALMLAQKKYQLTAFDFSPTLLKVLAKNVRSSKVDIQIIRGDMRKLPFVNKFDAVINMFTAFGYFSDEDNAQVIKNVSKSLKKGGKFVLDYSNPYRTTSFIVWREPGQDAKKPISKLHKLSNGIEITTEHFLDPMTARWFMHRTWVEKGRKKTYKTAVRLYSIPEIINLFLKYHLKDIVLFGDYDGSPFTPQSPRLIVFATRS